MNTFLESVVPELQDYIRLCDEVDSILIKSRVRKICIRCSTVKPYIPTERKELGCCIGCKYLSNRGCTTKSLACKLWFCSYRLRKLLSKKSMERISEISQEATSKGYYIARGGIVEVEFKINQTKLENNVSKEQTTS